MTETSYIEQTENGPIVVWSDKMKRRFGQLRGNQYEINGLLSQLVLEWQGNFNKEGKAIQAEFNRQSEINLNLFEATKALQTIVVNLNERIAKL